MTYEIQQIVHGSTMNVYIISYGSDKVWIKFNPARPLDTPEVTGDINRVGKVWMHCTPWLHDTIKNRMYDAIDDTKREDALASLFWLITGIEVGLSATDKVLSL